MSNFGANFRKAREAAGLPLEKIAADTRISSRFLTAIENEAFHLLPGGIFNRGFIKAYAEYLGLDPVQTLSDYDRMSATTQEPVDVLRTAERTASRTDRNLYLIAAAILLVLMGAYYFVTRGSSTPVEIGSEPAAAAQPALETPAALPPPAEAAPAVEPLAQPPAQPIAETLPVAQPVPATPPPASALSVDLNVKESTWIKIASDGQVVLSEILPPGASRRFSANRLMEVTIGNAAGATLQVNGRDLGQLGTNGQVREFRITPENAAQIKG